jgi:methylmalonyl-CoA mutase
VAAALGGASEKLAAGAAHPLQIIIPVGTSFFPGIALLRAVRSGLEQLTSLYGATQVSPYVVAITDQAALARVDEYSNLLRCTTSAMASVLGGADAVCVLPFDHHSGGSERGRRLSRNITHLLREESHLGRVSDPAHGAWYVEELTQGLGRAGWALFKAWEARGGLLSCLGEGHIQAELDTFKAEADRRVQAGERVVVGVNRFQEESHAS